MKRRKVLSMFMTAVLTFSSVLPQGTLVALAEGEDEIKTVAEEGDVLPFGLAGMPAGYRLSEEQLNMKQELKDHDVLTELAGMTEGVDYNAAEVITLADSEEEAQLIADAYNATLTCYANGVAELKLPEELSVADALSVAMSYEYAMPVVEPNYRTYLEEPVSGDASLEFNPTLGGSAAAKKDEGVNYGWTEWVTGDYENLPLFTNPDEFLRDPSVAEYQWMHDAIGTWRAWRSTMGDPSIRVAVIDTGVNPNHPDLAGRVQQIKVNDIDPSVYYSSHGTHVAGIIAASADNGIGVAGVAPDVNIVSLDIFKWSDDYNDCYCETAEECRALQICIDEKIPVANMSIGGFGYSALAAEKMKAAHDAGVSVFVAMGNENSNAKSYPAAYDGAIAVASTNVGGVRSFFSNFGDWCAIAAPGTDIMSCYNPLSIDDEEGEEYGLMSGTSMATPVAAGVAALYMSKVGVIAPDEMRDVMQKNAGKCSSKQIGAGIVNVGAMFANNEVTPEIGDYNEGFVAITTKTVDDNAKIVYTLDGKKPAVKAGAVTYGTVYEDDIDLTSYPSESKVTINALVISSQGKVSSVVTKEVTIAKAEAGKVEVESVSLDQATLSLGYSSNPTVSDNKVTAQVKAYVTVGGKEVSLSSVEHRWVTSDGSVADAYEEADGVATIFTKGVGSATITLEVYGTTMKSAAVKVNVSALADEIIISGPDVLVAGSEAKYSVSVLPKKIKDNQITWTVDTDKVTIDSKGKLKVAADAESFTLTATTESGASGVKYVSVVSAKVSALEVTSSDARFSKNSATIFNVDVPTIEGVDNELVLKANTPFVEWTSSNSKVAGVTSDGTDVFVVGRKAGKATITGKTTDGSKKKVTIKVNVNVPVSELILNVDANELGNITTLLGIGKSQKINYAFGTTYGKPSNTKLEWDYVVVSPQEEDLTAAIKASGAVKIDKKGKVSVDKKKWMNAMKGQPAPDAYLHVMAATTDGTKLVASHGFLVQEAATVFQAKTITDKGELVSIKNITLDKSKWINDVDKSDDIGYFPVLIETDAWLPNDICVNVSCSNTDILGVIPGGVLRDPETNKPIQLENGHFLYEVDLIAQTPECKGGKAKVTISCADGSKKKVTLNVTLK
ncbi:MAG: S8 family serine peptidase [Lachnospiraceae bacterium]|nr:S8 family serine peptidase [Lachnospiraceae bacterium]